LIDQDKLIRHIRNVSRNVAFGWPGVVDEEDLEQMIRVRILEAGPKYYNSLLEMDKAARETLLAKIGHQIATQERDDYELFTGNYKYSWDEMDHLLEKEGVLSHALHELQTVSPDYPGQDKVKGGPANSLGHDGDVVVEAMDLLEALDRIKDRNSDYYAVLVNKYKYGIQPERWSSEEKRLARAKRALLSEMNASYRRRFDRFQDGPGSRFRVSRVTREA